ncbi:hypothetical protein [Actinomadura violacea]|uniref:Uncharacterized protein n=1 Tax=Actinomadura violacea TaxID=2819934 RepID=A0ABS3RXY0_9ACTN|nr:hypothetical protein [Actinomadura violacea]MBO2461614.1 hypothetical protein [Actinomadura violacea]
MVRYGDFVPGRNPAKPLPTPGSDEVRALGDFIAGSDSYIVMSSGRVPAWHHRLGEVGPVPGWYIIGGLN